MSNQRISFKNFLTAIQESDHVTASKEFKSIIANKINDTFEAKKVEIGSRISEASSIPSRMVREYERTAKAEYRAGGTVEIDYRLPYVSVTTSTGEEYFFQGDEAQDLLDEVPDNMSPEDYVMAMSTSW